MDLQDTSRCVSFESGSTLAENIGACFSEVSAKTGHGIDQVYVQCTILFIIPYD